MIIMKKHMILVVGALIFVFIFDGGLGDRIRSTVFNFVLDFDRLPEYKEGESAVINGEGLDQMKVTVTKIEKRDSIRTKDGKATVNAKNEEKQKTIHYIIVDWKVKNTGNRTIKLHDNTHLRYRSTSAYPEILDDIQDNISLIDNPIDGMIRFNEHDVSIQPGESYEGYSVFEIFEGRDYVSFEFRGDEYLIESSEDVLIKQEHANWELD
jgi:uncharacterized cupredoxin-like copper-binding protein